MRAPGQISSAVLDRLREKGPATRIAVVGASNDPAKYGNIIVRKLHAKGYTVLPINPREKEIAGLTAYPTVEEAPAPVHLVNFVTPPAVTNRVLEGLDPAASPAVWFQDGSFDSATLKLAEEKKFPAVVHDACIVVLTNWV